MSVLVSVIIPCYNSENTLEETLQSVYNQDLEEWEAIIVNDGSPDNLERIALAWAKKDKRFKYFKKNNGGLATARNFGIRQGTGKYFLPLDSDNKVRKTYVKKAIEVFENNKSVGVVYGDTYRFGEVNRYWKVGGFNEYKMLNHNYIDACSLIRREVFDVIGLYDENMPYQGHEDWELWLRVITSRYDFYYLPEITFDYRVSKNSMIKSFNNKMLQENIEYIRIKHQELYSRKYKDLFQEFKKLKQDYSYLKKNNLALEAKINGPLLFNLKKLIKKMKKK